MRRWKLQHSLNSLYFTPAFNGVNFQLAVSCAGNGTWVNAVVSEVSSPTSASADINRLDGNGIDGFSPNDNPLSDEDDIPKGCVRSEELAGYMFQLESRKDGKPVDSYDMSALPIGSSRLSRPMSHTGGWRSLG